MNIYIYLHYLIIHWLIPGTIHYDFAQKLTIEKKYHNYQIRFATEKIIYILNTMLELGALFTVTIISCKK